MEESAHRVSRDCYDKFHQLVTTIGDAGEDLDITSLPNVISEHLTNLPDWFQFYFPAEDPQKGNGWTRNPLIPLQDNLNVSMEDKLLELAANEGLKRSFEITTSLGTIWIKVKAEYTELSEIVLDTLIPFPSTYLCETGLSTIVLLR